jgi:hypothetical protein
LWVSYPSPSGKGLELYVVYFMRNVIYYTFII